MRLPVRLGFGMLGVVLLTTKCRNRGSGRSPAPFSNLIAYETITILDGIDEGSDMVHRDLHDITRLKSEFIGRNESSSSEEDHSVREAIISTQPANQLIKGSDHLGDRCLTIEDNLACPLDFETDRD
jgi:hypothetical protein